MQTKEQKRNSYSIYSSILNYDLLRIRNISKSIIEKKLQRMGKIVANG